VCSLLDLFFKPTTIKKGFSVQEKPFLKQTTPSSLSFGEG